ncbi:MAG: hypothetical protein V7709_13200 [Halioglobus sp.]
MNTYKRHRFPPDIISYAVWLYYIAVRGQGLHGITDKISTLVSASGLTEGLCTLFIRTQISVPYQAGELLLGTWQGTPCGSIDTMPARGKSSYTWRE